MKDNNAGRITASLQIIHWHDLKRLNLLWFWSSDVFVINCNWHNLVPLFYKNDSDVRTKLLEFHILYFVPISLAPVWLHLSKSFSLPNVLRLKYPDLPFILRGDFNVSPLNSLAPPVYSPSVSTLLPRIWLLLLFVLRELG